MYGWWRRSSVRLRRSWKRKWLRRIYLIRRWCTDIFLVRVMGMMWWCMSRAGRRCYRVGAVYFSAIAGGAAAMHFGFLCEQGVWEDGCDRVFSGHDWSQGFGSDAEVV